MADYHSVLQRAIGNLPQNTGQARREIYDKARKALVRQLESFDPPLPPSEITAQRLALEEAIRRIETEVVRRSATQPRPSSVAPPAPAPAPRPAAPPAAARPAPRPAPVAPPAPVRAPVVEPPMPEPALPPQPAYVPHPEPVMPEPVAPPVAIPPVEPVPVAPAAEFRPSRAAPEPLPEAEDYDPAPLPPEPVAPPRARREPPVEKQRARPAAPVAPPEDIPAPPVRGPHETNESWAYAEDGRALPSARDFDPRVPPEDEDGFYSDAPDVTPPAERKPQRKARAVRPPADDDFARPRAAPVRSKAGGKGPNPRLLVLGVAVVVLLAVSVGAVYFLTSGSPSDPTQTADTSEPAAPATDVPPADGTDAAAPADGSAGKIADRLEDDVKRVPTRRIVTTPPEGTGNEEPPAAGDAAQTAATVPMPPAQEDAPAEPAGTMSATGDRAILYEEGAAQGSRGSAAVGKVSWKLVQESFANGPKEPMVRASVTIPERKVTVGLLFRQNHDPALPASYLVEITYELPDNFPGGGITNVPGIIMKATEDSRGDALLGASARVSDGLFWIALAQSPTDVARNDALLRDRNWIDIPMLYANGRRAIMTIEKGPEGDKALDAALDAWAKKAN